ncbi:MAG: peptidoglycan-binding domain-containing protein [Rhodospirillales bacterium]
MRRLFSLCAAAALGVSAALATLPAKAEPATDVAFGAMAVDLLNGIRDTDVSRLPAFSGYDAPAIAVQPLEGTDSIAAREYSDRFLVQLQRQGRDQFQFVDPSGLRAVIERIMAGDGTNEEKEDRINALHASSRADVLVIGNLAQRDEGQTLSWRAVSAADGKLLAVTEPRLVRAALSSRTAAWSEPPAPVAAPRRAVEQDDLPLGRLLEPSDRHRVIVAEVEALLAEKGYDPGPVDGVVTRQTRRALTAYQKDSALPMNGRLTRRVVENLRRDQR